ncbi:MAG: proteasome assembly chaperone family protein [Methanomassiliicoccales archaeon]|nr:proteasome assembly chaperone family protein [Methanomassiliicoccales archaeon]
MMNDFDIIELKRANLKGATVIEGFSSIGLVGSITANYLVNLLDLDLVAVLDSPYLPSVSIVRDGVPYSPVRVYSGNIGKKGNDKIVVIVSEFEPPQEILKPLAWAIMDWLEYKGCRMVISPEGLANKAGEEVEEQSSNEDECKVYAVASTPRAREVLIKNDIPVFENGVVVGLAGVLLNEGVNRNFDVVSILSEAHSDYPDARAAAAATEAIDRLLLHTQLDTQPLLEEAALIEEALMEIKKKTGESEELAKKRSIMYG